MTARAEATSQGSFAARVTDGLGWSWSAAARGALYALPAAIAMMSDTSRGFAFAVGVLPASILGMPPLRRERSRIVLLGVLAAVPLALGSVLSSVPVVAVVALFGLCVLAAVLATRAPIGQLALGLCLPMIGIGFSYDDVGQSVGLALLIVAGSVWAYLVALAWPDTDPPPRSEPRYPTRAVMLNYGIRLGAAASIAAAIGFALDLDHVGWATAAVLLVMRPAVAAQRTRMAGRIVSVALGSALAVGLIATDPAAGVLAVATVVALACASATTTSRWYVAPTFTTFIVFLLLLSSSPGDSADRFVERASETALGVALAFIFGTLVPWARRRRSA